MNDPFASEDISSQISQPNLYKMSEIQLFEIYQMSIDQSLSESPRSKYNRPKFHAENLFVETKRSSTILLSLRVMDITQPPNSGTLLSSSENEKQNLSYQACYEKADAFLDSQSFIIVLPEAETKVRKYVKVVAVAQSLSVKSETDSPLYCGSPSLQGISGSSLLARRANSKMQSPLSSKSDNTETCSRSLNLLALPLKISRFAENVQKESEIAVAAKKNEINSQLNVKMQEPDLDNNGSLYLS